MWLHCDKMKNIIYGQSIKTGRDGVKHDALILEHMLVNRSIHTRRAALQLLYNSNTVDLTLAPPV